MIIVIPSRGRANAVRTLDSIEHGTSVNIVVPTTEAQDYAKAVLEHRSRFDVKIHGVECSHIGQKRQWIINKWRGHKIVMLDDDLRFRRRYATDDRFVSAKPDDISLMIRTLGIALATTPHAGIADEFMCQHQPRGHKVGGRYNQVLAYDLGHYLFAREKYSPAFRLAINEEHDLHLQLARSGYKPIVLTDWTKGSKYNASGGCSTWRTPEFERAEFEKFARLWPDTVSINTDNKSSISGWSTRVNWARAYR